MLTDDDGRFMAIAIEEAAKTDPSEEWEKSPDQVPHVGAALVKDGTLVAKGYHGEVAVGDHAEYTVLERKLLNTDLRGMTLYTTLEPCTKRSSKKTACMRRVRLRGITRVIVGLIDPERLINGDGVQWLRDRGIEVDVFPESSDQANKLRTLMQKFLARKEAERNNMTLQLYQLAARSLADSLQRPRISEEVKSGVEKDIHSWAKTIRELGAPYWGSSLSVQVAPSLTEKRFGGWSLDQFIIKAPDPTAEEYPLGEYQETYSAYWEKFKDRKGFTINDGKKFMVDSISFSSTEVPKCLLTTRQTKYSVCVFFKDVVLAASKDATPRENDKKKILQLKLAADFLQTRTPKFPNSLCLHCVVVTSDDMVLVARRSSHLEYYPDAWSCSFEENLAEKDFSGVGSPTENWVERSLHEEIGLQKGTDYDMGDARILSVFLEAEPGILNVNLCGLVRLKLSSSELSELLSGRIRPDYEFSSWRYLSVVEDLPEELRNPSSGTYHPTSMYRMYLTLAWYYGKQLYDSGRSPSPKAPDL